MQEVRAALFGTARTSYFEFVWTCCSVAPQGGLGEVHVGACIAHPDGASPTTTTWVQGVVSESLRRGTAVFTATVDLELQRSIS